ncbi:MAG TPA: creatininase family protein [Gaiellaceae bacterium]|nr:creatininase family protein [Gaiellaceae bacterium]
MRLADRNWMQVEEYLRADDRVVLPVGSTEQHAYLSLATDSILAERVAVEAAEPLGVPVLPAMPFGIAPGFAAFPGTVSLTTETLAAVLSEVLGTLHGQGFRGFLVVNGHGGNVPVQDPLEAWAAGRDGARLRFHSWWDSEAVRTAAAEVYDGDATHASWFENFPWTRLPGVDLPAGEKPMITDREALRELDPQAVRQVVGDGSYGGPYAVSDEDAARVWDAGVAEVRALIEALRA